MGSVQQAVLEFDEAVQAPWRPCLRVVSGGGSPAPSPADGRAAKPGPYRNRVAGSRPAVVPAPQPRPLAGAAVRSRGPERASSRPAAAAARSAGPRPAGAPTPVRLTRRARRLAVALALAAGVAAGAAVGSWAGPWLSGDAGDLRLAGDSAVVVGPGDTLWSIASSVAGDRDVREVVDQIAQVNRLDGTALVPGQVLRLP